MRATTCGSADSTSCSDTRSSFEPKSLRGDSRLLTVDTCDGSTLIVTFRQQGDRARARMLTDGEGKKTFIGVLPKNFKGPLRISIARGKPVYLNVC